VDVASKERDYYELKRKLEDKITDLSRQLEQARDQLTNTQASNEQR
jgi:prefoldin subunit 5